MTSANVIYYTVTDRETGETVGRYRQNILCKDTVTEKLKSHQPDYLFHLTVNQPDEDEEDNYTYKGSLEEYLHDKEAK